MVKKLLKSLKLMLLTLLIPVLSASCGRQIGSDIYSAESIGSSSTTYSGTILKSRPVQIQEGDYIGDNEAGGIGGGIGGALLGSQLSHGSGNVLSTVAGAVIGATIGAFSEKAIKKQAAIEYIISLDNGETKSVVQGPKPLFIEGQKIWLISSNNRKNRSRIISRE